MKIFVAASFLEKYGLVGLVILFCWEMKQPLKNGDKITVSNIFATNFHDVKHNE